MLNKLEGSSVLQGSDTKRALFSINMVTRNIEWNEKKKNVDIKISVLGRGGVNLKGWTQELQASPVHRARPRHISDQRAWDWWRCRRPRSRKWHSMRAPGRAMRIRRWDWHAFIDAFIIQMNFFFNLHLLMWLVKKCVSLTYKWYTFLHQSQSWKWEWNDDFQMTRCESFEYDPRNQECALHSASGQPFGPSVLTRAEKERAFFQQICLPGKQSTDILGRGGYY